MLPASKQTRSLRTRQDLMSHTNVGDGRMKCERGDSMWAACGLPSIAYGLQAARIMSQGFRLPPTHWPIARSAAYERVCFLSWLGRFDLASTVCTCSAPTTKNRLTPAHLIPGKATHIFVVGCMFKGRGLNFIWVDAGTFCW